MKNKDKLKSSLSGASVFLRALDESDIERTYTWHNDSRLYETLGTPFRAVSKLSETEWLRRKASYSDSEINLAICIQPSGEHIGNIYLRNIDWVARKSELHAFIGCADHRGKGNGCDAVRQVLCHAFVDLNLNRIFLEVLADNIAAVKTYEKCGFEVEGRLKMHAFKLGKYKDVLVMGINADQYKDANEK